MCACVGVLQAFSPWEHHLCGQYKLQAGVNMVTWCWVELDLVDHSALSNVVESRGQSKKKKEKEIVIQGRTNKLTLPKHLPLPPEAISLWHVSHLSSTRQETEDKEKRQHRKGQKERSEKDRTRREREKTSELKQTEENEKTMRQDVTAPCQSGTSDDVASCSEQDLQT